MGASYADLARSPLSAPALGRALGGGWWREVRVVQATGSTNADVAAAARAGAPEGLVVLAERQTAGRGRLGRSWQAPPGTAVLGSVLLRPAVAAQRWPLLPLLAGLALRDAVGPLLPVGLKWPNDLLAAGSGRKLAGVLVEAVGDAAVVGAAGPAAVVGFGLNVGLRADELPDERAGSLALEGVAADRTALTAAVLRALAARYTGWRAVGGDPAAVLADYRAGCLTLGAPVRLSLPDRSAVTGTAVDVDATGRLVVRTPDGGVSAYSAGDVVHLRPPP